MTTNKEQKSIVTTKSMQTEYEVTTKIDETTMNAISLARATYLFKRPAAVNKWSYHHIDMRSSQFDSIVFN